MDDIQNDAIKQAKRDEAVFAIVMAIIHHGHCLTFKERLKNSEIDAMFVDIGVAFGFVSLESHEAYCNYAT